MAEPQWDYRKLPIMEAIAALERDGIDADSDVIVDVGLVVLLSRHAAIPAGVSML